MRTFSVAWYLYFMPDICHPPLRRLADVLLPGGLDDFVQTRRGAGVAWRVIEREIYQATEGQVDVTAQTLRTWYAELAA